VNGTASESTPGAAPWSRWERHYDPGIDILFVCTGNICRSPIAEALLRARLEAVGAPAQVSSGGLLFDGRGAEPGAVAALARDGLDLTSHVSRTITAEMVSQADLVITMEYRHIREVATLDPAALGRTFTLPELVARATAVGARHRLSFADWLARLVQGRTADDVLRGDPTLEVTDPMGGSKRQFRRSADEVGELLDWFVALAWPSTERGGASTAGRAQPTQMGSV